MAQSTWLGPVSQQPAQAVEPLPSPSQPPVLSLAALEEMALRNNPSLGRMLALVGAARGNWLQVGLPPNPSFGYEGEQLGSGGQAEQHGIFFEQELVRLQKLRLNRAVAAQEIAQAQQQLGAQQLRVLTDVRIAFFQVLLAQRQIDVTIDLVRISWEELEAAEALLRAKEGARVDVLQAQIELANAQILAENARNRHRAAWQSLAAVVGQPLLPPQPLAGDAYAPPKVYDFHATLERLHTASPEVAARWAEVDRARLALERARVEPRPNVTVLGLVNVVDNGIGGKPDGTVGLALPVPLWNRNQGAILQAQHELAAAQQALAQLELDLQARLAPVFERYANARYQVQRYRSSILPTARESLDLMGKLYAAGETDYVNLLTVQRTYAHTTLGYLEALSQLRTAEAEIDGLLLSDSLELR